ncbi:MAG: sulfite exporter TauE/SafE family protein [Kiloniellaceae bacterium]
MDTAALWAHFSGERFLWLAGAAALAGLVRGFSGFGAAMIFLPLAGIVVRPEVAVPLLFVADNLATLHITLPSFRRCCWMEILPLAGGATLTIPLGVALLVSVDPQTMRWAISLLVLLAVGVLASGWRLQRSLPLAGTAAVGGLAGLAGGAASLYGPPLILFWLGGRSGAAQVRENIYAVFGLLSVAAGITQWLNGLLTLAALREALTLLPVYALATVAGARLFRHASDAHYRWAALGLCALVAVAGLPLWQKF